jgi:anaerobic C4-dicarboxylate transporter
MVWIELRVLLACILVGARLGGIGLGTVAGLGLVVLVFIFGLPPGMPPRTVLGMIVAVVTAAATMQAAGGLKYLAAVADRALRVWPGGITIIAPLVTYFVTFAAGTVHIVYALLPVIFEVSRKAGVAPNALCRSRPSQLNRRSRPLPFQLQLWPCWRCSPTRHTAPADSYDLCTCNLAGQLNWCTCGFAERD